MEDTASAVSAQLKFLPIDDAPHQSVSINVLVLPFHIKIETFAALNCLREDNSLLLMATLIDFVRQARWFEPLNDEQRSRVEDVVTEQAFAAGATVVSKGESVDAWYGVIEGLMKVHTDSPDGKSVTFAGIPAGGWVGEGSLLRTEPRRYGLIALRTTRVAYLPRSTFEWLLDTSIAFNRFLLEQLNERLAQFIAMMEYQRLLDTDARIARCIGEMFNSILYPGNGNRIAISQEEIGFLTGASRQRVNRALRKLEAEGLLSVEYGAITVADVETLRRFGS